jgi:F-type H+-transporting ATPase subunit alpha
VKRTRKIASINVGEGMLGRVVDTLGMPIDGKGAITGKTYEMPFERKAPGVIVSSTSKRAITNRFESD